MWKSGALPTVGNGGGGGGEGAVGQHGQAILKRGKVLEMGVRWAMPLRDGFGLSVSFVC
jgi:hypothetical protein